MAVSARNTQKTRQRGEVRQAAAIGTTTGARGVDDDYMDGQKCDLLSLIIGVARNGSMNSVVVPFSML
jgi:hypothetical protein